MRNAVFLFMLLAVLAGCSVKKTDDDSAEIEKLKSENSSLRAELVSQKNVGAQEGRENTNSDQLQGINSQESDLRNNVITSIIGSWEHTDTSCCGDLAIEDFGWQAVPPSERASVTFLPNGEFTSNNPNNAHGRWTIDQEGQLEGWQFTTLPIDISGNTMIISHISGGSHNFYFERWKRVDR